MNKGEYETMYNVEQDHWWYVGLRQHLFFWIKRLAPTKILDAGCGTGMNIMTAQHLGYTAHGFDQNTEAIKFCKARNLKNISKGKLQERLYDPKSFELVYCMDVLDLLEEKEILKSLRIFNFYLKDKGFLIINSATYQWLYSSHDTAVRTLYRYSKKSLIKYLRKSGFRVVTCTYRIFLLFPIVVIVKMFLKILALFKKPAAENTKGDLDKTSPIINKILNLIMSLENFILQKFRLPFGSSIFIVAQKI